MGKGGQRHTDSGVPEQRSAQGSPLSSLGIREGFQEEEAPERDSHRLSVPLGGKGGMGVPGGSDISPGGEECDHGAQPAGGSLKGCHLGVEPFSKGLNV